MMLWDIIRDFFVKYIFGGFDSNGDVFYAFFGRFMDSSDGVQELFTSNLFVRLSPNNHDYGLTTLPNDDTLAGNYVNFITMGDYLSTTATIITLVVLAVVVALGIRWLFRFMISRFTKWGL